MILPMITLASSVDMSAKLTLIAPEILLFVGAVVVAVLVAVEGSSNSRLSLSTMP